MSEPLDVSLRLRLQYEAGGAARAIADIDKLKDKAAQLGTVGAGKLAADLDKVKAPADAATKKVADLAEVAAKLGTTTGGGKLAVDLDKVKAPADAATKKVADLAEVATKLGTTGGGGKLAVDLDKVKAPAEMAARSVIDLGAAASRLGHTAGVKAIATDVAAIGKATEPVKRDVLDLAAQLKKIEGVRTKPFENIELGKNPRRDLQALERLTGTAKRNIINLGEASDKLGSGPGPAKLERELGEVGRRADEARRRLDMLGSAGGGHGGGRGFVRGGGERGEAWEFGREALASAGMGNAVRFGMGGAVGAGMAAGAGVAAIGAGMALATKQAISFETEMSEVNKAVNNLSPEGFKELERVILRTARETGIAKEQIARGVAQAGFAGIPNEDLPRFATFAAKAGGAFEMSAEEAGDRLAKMRNIYKLNQAGIEDLADGINYLGDNTAAKERQIVDFMERVGASTQAFGLKPVQTAAIGATMEATGMAPEVAGSAIQALTTHLSTADKQSKRFNDALRELHLTSRQVMGAIKVDPLQALYTVLERINKLPSMKQAGIAAELTGLAHGPEIMTIAGQYENLVKNVKAMEDQSLRAGSVEKTFAIFSATTQAKIDRMTQSIGSFAVKLGQSFSPAVGAAADVVARFFNNLNDGAERAEKAQSIVDKIAKGLAIAPEDKAAIDADPKLKAKIEAGQENLERNAIRDQGHGPVTTTATKPKAPAAAEPEDPEAVAARERGRAAMDRQIEDYQTRVTGHVGDPAVQEQNRLKLFDLQRRRRLTFPDAPAAGDGKFPIKVAPAAGDAAPADPAAAAPAAPAAPVQTDGVVGGDRQGSLPATDKQAMALATRATMAAYYDEVDRGLSLTTRRVHDFSVKIRDDLTIRARFDTDIAPGQGGGIIKTSYGDDGVVGGGLGARPGGGRLNIFGGPAGGGDAASGPAGGAPSLRYNRQHQRGAAGATDGAMAPQGLADAIMKAEGTTKDGYDTLLGYGKWGRPSKPISTMTLDEVNAFGLKERQAQQRAGMPWEKTSSANGAFQITGSTMLGAAKALRMDPKTTIFDGSTQKKMAGWIAKTQGLGAWEGLKAHPALGAAAAGFLPRGQFESSGSAVRGGSASAASSAVDTAMSLQGAGATAASRALASKMTNGQWCADLVNGVFNKAGIQGSGSSMALSFAKWGQAVTDFGKLKKGDVLVENHGGGHGHAGLFTGQRDARGRLGMISGNYGDQVRFNWEDPRKIAAARRAYDADGVTANAGSSPRFADPSTMKPRAGTPAASPAGGTSGGTASHQPARSMVQNFYGNHDPAETARFAMIEQNREVRRSQARALHGIGRVA